MRRPTSRDEGTRSRAAADPRLVRWGEGTLDEMCLTALGVGYSF